VSDATHVTRLLLDWRGGNAEALDDLLPLVYDELRRLAARHMVGEADGHTLQPTALVHEAYVRLVDADIEWQDRAHFFAAASRVMRRMLVDHARARGRQKRGGGRAQVTLHNADAVTPPPNLDLLALDEALETLATQDPRKARAVELRYFGGLNLEEIAEVTDVSIATVHRDLRMATAWLMARLSDEVEDADGVDGPPDSHGPDS
jgi:RNA polymerase sigma factor (TIGR02999 family)